MYYECLWYETQELENANFQSFRTKKQALDFYEKHRNDEDKFGWWVTKRDKYDDVIEDIIY